MMFHTLNHGFMGTWKLLYPPDVRKEFKYALLRALKIIISALYDCITDSFIKCFTGKFSIGQQFT